MLNIEILKRTIVINLFRLDIIKKKYDSKYDQSNTPLYTFINYSYDFSYFLFAWINKDYIEIQTCIYTVLFDIITRWN